MKHRIQINKFADIHDRYRANNEAIRHNQEHIIKNRVAFDDLPLGTQFYLQQKRLTNLSSKFYKDLK